MSREEELESKINKLTEQLTKIGSENHSLKLKLANLEFVTNQMAGWLRYTYKEMKKHDPSVF